MFTFKSFALVVCGMAAFLFMAEESYAQSSRKSGSSNSSRYRSRSSQGSETKVTKVTGRLSGNLDQMVMMEVFDSNGDDVVSKKEVSNLLLLLTGLDTNRDGRITAEEMSEEAIMTVAPRFEEDKKRAMVKEMEMKEKMEMEAKEKMEVSSQDRPELADQGSSRR